MKSAVLTPYCPLPADHGGKVEMWKHLNLLRTMGECSIVSAASRPAGMGWTDTARQQIEERGFSVRLREELHPARSWRQLAGLAYGAVCKGLGLERAFGHANPYHRHAFPPDFLLECSRDADLVVINYSYWAWLPTRCPKVVIVHDLLSQVMRGGCRRETEELAAADLVVVISKDEEIELRRRGLTKVLWNPPLVQPSQFPLTEQVGLIGSVNRFNQEGLRWLSQAAPPALPVSIYGGLAQFANWPEARKTARYADSCQPYQDCGIILLPTASGTGVQIKVVEALAAGRAIVARKGALRGLPPGAGAWLEVDSPQAMWAQASRLSRDAALREEQAAQARAYYRQHLDAEKLLAELRAAYAALAQGMMRDHSS
ncbi:glycosyltransferase family protein [Candidatus Electronema sp. JC]|uniref:glycosyltransferase family protein n=1 Tax=Candidatus Electronema sp. JC TaxID=3401570 RepID=UPI003B43AB52